MNWVVLAPAMLVLVLQYQKLNRLCKLLEYQSTGLSDHPSCANSSAFSLNNWVFFQLHLLTSTSGPSPSPIPGPVLVLVFFTPNNWVFPKFSFWQVNLSASSSSNVRSCSGIKTTWCEYFMVPRVFIWSWCSANTSKGISSQFIRLHTLQKVIKNGWPSENHRKSGRSICKKQLSARICRHSSRVSFCRETIVSNNKSKTFMERQQWPGENQERVKWRDHCQQ